MYLTKILTSKYKFHWSQISHWAEESGEKVKWKCIQFYAWMKLANTSSYNCTNIARAFFALFSFFKLISFVSSNMSSFPILGHLPKRFILQLVCSLWACAGSPCNSVISFCYSAEQLQVWWEPTQHWNKTKTKQSQKNPKTQLKSLKLFWQLCCIFNN